MAERTVRIERRRNFKPPDFCRFHAAAHSGDEVVAGQDVLGLRGDALGGMAKGAREKPVLAWWLRPRTTVLRSWVSGRLGMGDESRVTQAVREVREANDATSRNGREQLKNLE